MGNCISISNHSSPAMRGMPEDQTSSVPMNQIGTSNKAQLGVDGLPEPKHSESFNTYGLDFTVDSFRSKPSQTVRLLTPAEYRDTEHAYYGLPEDGEIEAMENGGTAVGISAVGFDSNKLISNSFQSCVPIAAFYPDGKMGLYHAGSAPVEDRNRQSLIDRKPTDVFIVFKGGNEDGVAKYTPKETFPVSMLLRDKNLQYNLHIVKVPCSQLAIEVSSGTLEISQMYENRWKKR